MLVSTATAVEFLIVALGKGEDVYQSAIAMLGSNDIELVPWTMSRRSSRARLTNDTVKADIRPV